MLQFSIQHYLMFARESITVQVWQCTLTLKEKPVVVPFVTGLRFGGVPTRDGSPRRFEIQRPDSPMDRVKLFDLYVWAVNDALYIRPQDPSLVMESFLVPPPIKPEDRADPEKCQNDVIREVAIECKDGPLPLTVDGRTYGPVAAIAIAPFKDPCNAARQMTVSIATFTPVEN
jgi:hypothetical protein